MARGSKKDTLKRKTGGREYREVKFPKDIHPDRRNPTAVLKRFRKAMRTKDFRKGDEVWIVVEVDAWEQSEFAELLSRAESNPRHTRPSLMRP